MGTDNRELPIEKTIGDAVRGLVRRRWKNNAAKMLERQWGLDPKTARNVVGNGHVSERTLTKAVRAEGWDFIAALGVELTGQSYEQHLEIAIEETARAQENLARRRDHVRQLEARAFGLDGMGDRLDA